MINLDREESHLFRRTYFTSNWQDQTIQVAVGRLSTDLNQYYPIAMPYPEPLVAPMRAELTTIGVQELRTAEEVDQVMTASESGTTLLIVNSVCGCAAAMARPAVRMAMQAPQGPDRMVTVFAGQDLEATTRARQYLMGIPPSSPFMALMKDGDPVFVLERRHIEGRSASAIATDLVNAYAHFCGSDGEQPTESESQVAEDAQPTDVPDTFRSIL